jgi:hypothetical protein
MLRFAPICGAIVFAAYLIISRKIIPQISCSNAREPAHSYNFVQRDRARSRHAASCASRWPTTGRSRSAPPKGCRMASSPRLLQTGVFLFLVADIFADQLFVSAHCRAKYPLSPKGLTREPAFPFRVNARQMDRALAIDIPNHLRDQIFRRKSDHHVNVIGHQMPLLYSAFLVRGQLLEHLSKVRA